MDHSADSTAKLCQVGKGMYVGREGIPMDDSSGKECEPVIVFESLDMSQHAHSHTAVRNSRTETAMHALIIWCLRAKT